MSSRTGFSLIEVVLSLGLIATALLTLAMMMPQALRTQQLVRMQGVAAARAISIGDAIAQGNPRFPGFTGTDAAGAGISNGSYAYMLDRGGALCRPSFPDAEQIIAGNGRTYYNNQTGIPVPVEIARRLDADQDEIKEILDAGGALFYPPPGSLNGMSAIEYSASSVPGTAQFSQIESSTDQQRLVFAVNGLPQQNLLPVHPAYNLPIYKLYPFPPDTCSKVTWTYYVIGINGTENEPFSLSTLYNPNPTRTVTTATTGEIRNVWQYFKDQYGNASGSDFDKAWLAIWERTYADYLVLSRYGWTPIAFKLTPGDNKKDVKKASNWLKKAGGTDKDPVPKVDYDNFIATLADPKWGYGTRITDDGASGTVFINSNPKLYYAPPGPTPEPLDPNETTLPMPDSWFRLIAPFDPVDVEPYDGLTPVDPYPVGTFKKGDGINLDRYREPPGLPSLEMRRYYRRLALQLWMRTLDIRVDPAASHTPWAPGADSNAFEKEIPTSKNPLLTMIAPKTDVNHATILSGDDLCDGENWRYPHPARIYALSFLAHAAMLVTGARGPLMATDPVTGYGRFKPDGTATLKDEPPGMYDVFPTDAAMLGASTAAWLYCDMNQDHPGLGSASPSAVFDDEAAAMLSANRKYFDGQQLLKEDLDFARFAHENCMRWIAVYAAENPNDLCCPRPANRQSCLDRPLWSAELFPSGVAQRGSSPLTYYNFLEPYYKVVSDRTSRLAPTFVGKQKYNTDSSLSWNNFNRLINPNWTAPSGLSKTGDAGSFHRSTDSASDKPWLLKPAVDSTSFHFNHPFDASERCRELVFWSVDWMNYEDAETAPSAPFDAAFMYTQGAAYGNNSSLSELGGVINSVSAYTQPEWPFRWLRMPRLETHASTQGSLNFSAIGDSTVAGREWMNGFGQFGADRNGNGRCDIGPIPKGRRLRADTVARFVFYDPVGPCGVRR